MGGFRASARRRSTLGPCAARGEADRFERHGLVTLDHRSGPDDGPPVVLVHGIGVGASSLSRLAPLLAVLGPVHALDLPGFGGAPKPDHALSVEELATCVVELLETLGRPVLLVGQSMGVEVVWRRRCGLRSSSSGSS